MLHGQNSRMVIGDTKTIRITVSKAADLDLSAAVAYYQVSKSKLKAPLISKLSSNGGIVVSSPNDTTVVMSITLEDVDTINMEPDNYIHEAAFETVSGAIITVMDGNFRLDPSLIARGI